MSAVFMGEYRHAMDGKGRLFIPARFRSGLGERFVVTKGLDRCVFVYNLPAWEAIQVKLRDLSFTRADARAFTRFFLAGAAEVEPDRQGRILLPTSLREHANLIRDSVVIGVGERVEIWAEETWTTYVASTTASAEELAEKLGDLGGV